MINIHVCVCCNRIVVLVITTHYTQVNKANVTKDSKKTNTQEMY